MQIASVLVAIGGDLGNTIPKHGVTASEIAVLRAIHGEGAVSEIKPIGDVKRTNSEERNRLLTRYGRAKDSENNSIVNNLFPGAAARMFATIDELGLPSAFFAAAGRVSAVPAEPVPEPEPAVSTETSEPAKAGAKDDEVGDMADASTGDTLFQ